MLHSFDAELIAAPYLFHHAQVYCNCLVFRYLHVEPNSLNSLRAYLASGAIPGVGEKTAQYMVEGLGQHVIDVLNGPDAVTALMGCAKIGRLTATKIKQSWDAGRGQAPVLRSLRWCLCRSKPKICVCNAQAPDRVSCSCNSTA